MSNAGRLNLSTKALNLKDFIKCLITVFYLWCDFCAFVSSFWLKL